MASPSLKAKKPRSAPAPLRHGRKNAVSRGIGRKKLNGQFYTPLPVAEAMLAKVAWPEDGGALLDPACGDGVFLEAALRKLARTPRDCLEALPDLTLSGWDLDRGALKAARRRLSAVMAGLDLPPSLTPRLQHRDALAGLAPEARCLLGNPPYLESKRMPDPLKAQIRERFPQAATGAFDLYGAFVALCLEAAPREFSLLLPNRFLVTQNAAPLRRTLLERYQVEVEDLSRDDVFEGASVYPVVLRARRRSRRPRRGAPRAAGGSAANSRGRAPAPARHEREAVLPVRPASRAGRRLFERLLRDPELPRLHDRLELRWTVSFHRAGLRERFVGGEEFAQRSHARAFLGGGRFCGNREVEPCKITWRGGLIDYDEARAREAKNPLPPEGLFAPPALVICQNARRLRCAVDTEGFVLKDTFLHGRPRRGGVPTLQGLSLLLHSDLLHFFYEHLWGGTRKAGGHLHFLGRTLEGLPLPAGPLPASSERIDTIYRRCGEGDPGAFAEAEALVRQAFCVSTAEHRALERYPMPPHSA